MLSPRGYDEGVPRSAVWDVSGEGDDYCNAERRPIRSEDSRCLITGTGRPHSPPYRTPRGYFKSSYNGLDNFYMCRYTKWPPTAYCPTGISLSFFSASIFEHLGGGHPSRENRSPMNSNSRLLVFSILMRCEEKAIFFPQGQLAGEERRTVLSRRFDDKGVSSLEEGFLPMDAVEPRVLRGGGLIFWLPVVSERPSRAQRRRF